MVVLFVRNKDAEFFLVTGGPLSLFRRKCRKIPRFSFKKLVCRQSYTIFYIAHFSFKKLVCRQSRKSATSDAVSGTFCHWANH